jgi:tartrate-resistant acid phosphatase type 5
MISPRAVVAALIFLSACSRTRAPDKKPTAGPEGVRFAVIGDFGADTEAEAAVAKLVHSWSPDFVITTGDNNYPLGEASTIDANIGKYYAEFIGDYHGAYGPGSKVNRFWPSPGNHDWATNTLGPYVEYFSLAGNERYYDVDLGLVHLYALDSDPHEPDGTGETSVQGQWLKGKLAASKACYDIVYFHHPPFSSGTHGSSAYMRWPFRAWGAEAVLAGHDHTYERFEIDGIPYFVNGLGGASKYEFSANHAVPSKFQTNGSYGAMRVSAGRDGIAYQFWSVTDGKLDEVDLPMKCGGGG